MTTVVPVEPDLTASLTAVLRIDADGNGVTSPGDTLRYLVGASNPGLVPVDAVQLALTPGGGASEALVRDLERNYPHRKRGAREFIRLANELLEG